MLSMCGDAFRREILFCKGLGSQAARSSGPDGSLDCLTVDGEERHFERAPGGELKRLVRVAMYCFGKVGRKYLDKKREEERSVLIVTRSGPGLTDRTLGVQRPSCTQGQSWRLSLAQVPANISYKAGVNYRYKLIFGATWIYSVRSGLRDRNGFLPARDVKRNFDAQLRAVVSSRIRGARSHSLNHCGCRARRGVLTDSSECARKSQAAIPALTLRFPEK